MEEDFLMCMYDSTCPNTGIRLRWERGDRASVKWKIRLSLQLIVHLCQCCNENPLSKNNFCIRLLGYTSLVCTCLRQQCPSVASYLLTKMGLTSRKLCRLNFPFSLLNKNFFFFLFPNDCWDKEVSTLGTEWDQLISLEMVQMLWDCSLRSLLCHVSQAGFAPSAAT